MVARLVRDEEVVGSNPASPTTHRSTVALAAIVAVGVALRVAWAVVAARPSVGLNDPSMYVRLAEGVAAGNGYRTPAGSTTAYYPVGYPGALGLLLRFARATPLPDAAHVVAAGANIVLAGVGIALTGAIGRRVAGARVGLLAAAGVAVYPNLVFHSTVALTETMFIALALGAVAVAVRSRWAAPRPAELVALGVLVGAATLVRPPGALLLPAFVVVGWWYGRWPWRRAAKVTAVAGVAALAVLAPWVVRNAVVLGRPVLSTNTGDNLCIGNRPDATGGFVLPPEVCWAPVEHLDGIDYELARDDLGREVALDHLRDDPGDQLRLLVGRLRWTFLKGDADGLAAAESYGLDRFLDDGVRRALERAANTAYVVVAVLAVVGAPFLAQRTPGGPFLLASTLALLAPVLVLFGDLRFKVPLLPLLILSAAAGVVGLLELVRTRSARPAS